MADIFEKKCRDEVRENLRDKMRTLKVGNKGMVSMMEEKRVFHPSQDISKRAYSRSMERGPIASTNKIRFADALLKTRSGKIMRRILHKHKIIVEGNTENLADVTTLG